MKTQNGSRRKWSTMYVLVPLLLIYSGVRAQQDVLVKLNETQLNEALATLIDARGVNFGDYTGQFIADAWFVNLDGGSVDIRTGNAITIHANIVATAVDVFGVINNVTIHASLDINGTVRLDVVGGGYKLMLHAQSVSNFSATGTFLDDLIQGVANGFINQMPEIELNSGTKLLPDAITSYFTNSIPMLTTTDTDIIFYYTIAGPRQVRAYNEVNQKDNVGTIQEVVNGNPVSNNSSPGTFWWNVSETHQLQTPMALLDETNGKNKYRSWLRDLNPNAISEVAPRRIQLVVDNDAAYKAKFDQSQRVQLSNYLLETQSGGGTVSYNGTSVPSYDDYDFQYTLASINTNVPGGTQGLDWAFQNWSDGNTSQSRNIVLNSDVNLVAKYKAHLRSSSAAVTAPTAQRKIIRDANGAYHIVYEAANHIWYCKSTDGTNWGPEVRLSEDYYSLGAALNHTPSMTVQSNPHLMLVVWEVDESNNTWHDVYFCTVNPATGVRQTYPELIGISSGSPIPLIASGVATDGTIYALLVYFDAQSHSIIAWVRRASDGSWVGNAVLRQADASALSLAPISYGTASENSKWHLVWLEGGNL
jgi:hypothetical protein